eukprot:scaffold43996_cov24-Tisochrysis_lutea.AAC.4
MAEFGSPSSRHARTNPRRVDALGRLTSPSVGVDSARRARSSSTSARRAAASRSVSGGAPWPDADAGVLRSAATTGGSSERGGTGFSGRDSPSGVAVDGTCSDGATADLLPGAEPASCLTDLGGERALTARSPLPDAVSTLLTNGLPPALPRTGGLVESAFAVGALVTRDGFVEAAFTTGALVAPEGFIAATLPPATLPAPAAAGAALIGAVSASRAMSTDALAALSLAAFLSASALASSLGREGWSRPCGFPSRPIARSKLALASLRSASPWEPGEASARASVSKAMRRASARAACASAECGLNSIHSSASVWSCAAIAFASSPNARTCGRACETHTTSASSSRPSPTRLLTRHS